MHRWRAEMMCAGTVLLALATAPIPAAGQTAAYDGPRTHDDKPDLNGVWQAFTTASWDIEDHNAEKGVPAGQGIVKGGGLPYQPWAAAQKLENYEHRMERDALHSCYLPRRAAHHVHAVPVRGYADSNDDRDGLRVHTCHPAHLHGWE